ncbi:MAG: hypothetical protein J0L62_05990 [Bacteroidetes bacterium]|nr:hypothetical protein [Bacteroidota bacterium]
MKDNSEIEHHLAVLKRVYANPERYNQLEINNVIFDSKDFFCLNPNIPASHRTWYSNFQWHELFSSGFQDFIEMAEKTRNELQQQNQSL